MIAIIPARGGSKRIPRKNLKEFAGKPIISYSIEVALKSKLFTDVVVSTDDIEIADLAKSLGASVPFMRSAANSNDYAGTFEVIEEVVLQYESLNKTKLESICCLYPTAPFVSIEVLNRAHDIFLREQCGSVFPVVRYGYPPQRSLLMDNNKRVRMWFPENYSTRSQDLEPIFHDAGQFYILNRDAVFNEKRLYTKNSFTTEVSNLEVQDIDNEEDWIIAELKYSLLKH